MPGNKEQQEISVVGRLLSLEALVFVMGAASLIYGVVTGSHLKTVLGAAVLFLIVLVFRFCRRRRGK
jgi:Flp pilus assembly protein TadB